MRLHRLCQLLCALLVLLSLLSDAALARKPAATAGKDKKHAAADKALLARVDAAVAARDFVAAYRMLADGYRRARSPVLLFQLGRVAAAEGRTMEAQDLMRRYLADPARESDEPVNQEAQRILKLARPEGGSGEVAVLSDPGAAVLVDDRLVGTLPLPQPLLLAGGTHTVTVEYSSKKLSSPVQVASGRLMDMRFNPVSGAVVFTLRPALLFVMRAPGISEDAARALREVTEQAAQNEQLRLLYSDEALTAKPQLRSCLDTARCQRQLARENKVDYALISSIQSTPIPQAAAKASPAPASPAAAPAATPATTTTATELAAWQFSVLVRNSDIDEPASKLESSCASCTAEQAATALKESLAKVLPEGLRRPRALVEVTSDPAGAEVRVSGEVMGQTPLQLSAWQGPLMLEVIQAGFASQQRKFEVGKEARQSAAFKLESNAPPPPQPVVAAPVVPAAPPRPTGREPRPLWRLITGGVALAAGAGLIGFGISALSLGDQCTMPPANPAMACRQLYDTTPAGAGLVAGGGALLMGGAVLIAIPGSQRK